MEKEILELEKILEQEISACSKLGKYITDKKDFLIQGNIEGLIKTDIELEKYNSAIEKLEEKRKQLYPDNSLLNQIIENIEEKSKTRHIKNLKDKLNSLLVNIQKQNNINADLIKHSLNIIENSISSITNILVPENFFYDSKGKVKNGENTEIISSIIHEA